MSWLLVDHNDWTSLLTLIQRIDNNTHDLDSKLNQLLTEQQNMETEMAIDFTAANAEIARNTDVVASVKLLLADLTQKIADLKTASTDPATQAAIDALVASLKTNDDTAAAAVVANTQAAP